MVPVHAAASCRTRFRNPHVAGHAPPSASAATVSSRACRRETGQRARARAAQPLPGTGRPIMKIIFWFPQTDASTWLHGLARALPDAELREWQPGDTDPADYAVVWHPPRELFGVPGLRAIFNLGAGVDAILAHERERPGTLPGTAMLVRLEDSGMGRQMSEYVQHAVL